MQNIHLYHPTSYYFQIHCYCTIATPKAVFIYIQVHKSFQTKFLIGEQSNLQ